MKRNSKRNLMTTTLTFEMIQNIVEDQIQNNSEITAQPIIWREKHVEIDQAE